MEAEDTMTEPLFGDLKTLPAQRKSLTLNVGDETGPFQQLEEVDGAQRFDISFASPDPDMRTIYAGGRMKSYYDSIRCDETMNLRLLNDNAPFLLNHENTPQATIGVVEKAYLKDGKARAVVRMSKGEVGQKYAALIQEKILSKVSLTYHVDDYVERAELAKDGNPIYNTSITPVEISLVAVPRDHNVGFGKSADDEQQFPFTVKYAERDKGAEKPSVEDTPQPSEPISKSAVSVQDNSKRGSKMTDEVKDEGVSAVEALQKKNADLMEVGAMYEKYGGQKMAYEYVQKGGSVSDLNAALLAKMKTDLESKADSIESRTGAKEIGLTEKETQTFSLARAAMAQIHPQDASVQKAAAFELDVMKSADGGSGWGLPAEFFDSPYNPYPGIGLPSKAQSKALTLGTLAADIQGSGLSDGDASNLRGVTNLVESFVDYLRGRNIFMDLVTVSSGNVNSLQWAVQDGGIMVDSKVDEVTASPGPRKELSIIKRTLDYERMAAYGTISSAARIMSAPAAEMILRNDISSAMNAAITKRMSDLLYTGGVALEQVRGTTPTGAGAANMGYVADWAWVRNMLKKVESADSLNEQTSMWFMHPDLFYHLAGVQVASGTNGRFILDYERGRTIFGYGVRKSTIMKNDFTKGSGTDFAGAVFGDASQILFAEWGTPQLITDDSDLLRTGFYKVGIERFVNEGLMRDKSLVKSEALASLN